MHALKPIRGRTLALLLLAAVALGGSVFAWSDAASPAIAGPGTKAPDGWTAEAPRDEIRPAFAFDPTGGPDGKGVFRITADKREGLAGYWEKTFSPDGGKHHPLTANLQT